MPPQQSKPRSDRSSKFKAFPEDWSLGDAEIVAARIQTNWDDATVKQEFEKFCDWQREREGHSANWAMAWRSWCRRGMDYQKQRGSKSLSSHQSAVLGVNNWLEARKTRH